MCWVATSVSVGSPGAGHGHHARAIGRPAKTDAINAQVLAQFAAQVRPAARPQPDGATRERRAVVRRRRQVVAMIVAETNHQGSAPPFIQRSIAAHLVVLRAERAALDREIARVIAAHPTWRPTVARRPTAKGVGPGLAATVLADLPELGQRTPRQAAALVGVAPLNRDSGRRRGPRQCWGGRAAVRTALFMPPRAALRSHPVIAAFYARLIAAGKPEKVAGIACMRKLLVRLNAMLRDGVPWHDTPAAEVTPMLT